MKIYVFGNPFVEEDSLPLQLVPYLQKKFPSITFQITDPNDNFPPENEKELFILDTVKGINVPKLLYLKDFEKNGKTPISPHDYDLLFHLLLLKKLKKIARATISGVPQNFSIDEFLSGIIRLISHISLLATPLRQAQGKPTP